MPSPPNPPFKGGISLSSIPLRRRRRLSCCSCPLLKKGARLGRQAGNRVKRGGIRGGEGIAAGGD